jgi:hypothetical protein
MEQLKSFEHMARNYSQFVQARKRAIAKSEAKLVKDAKERFKL